jgi:integrase
MAHIRKLGERRYQARWVDPDGRECSKIFSRRTDAEDKIKEVEHSKLDGSYIDHKNPITVAQYAKQWSTTRPHRSTTATRVKSMIDNHIAGTRLGGRRLSAVRTSEVQAWVTERSQTLSPGTVRLVVQTLRSIFNAAVQDRLLARNPVTRLSMPRSEKQRITPLSVIEVQDLAGAMPDRCRAMVITQAGLGLRVAELLALRVQDVDFLRRTVRVEFQTTPDGKYRVPPKTPRSRRALPLPEVVGKALAAHIAEFPPTEDGSLFTTANGNLYRHEHYGARIFAPSVKKAELPAGTTSHALRHHYASVLLAAGESVVAVAERLGHENAALVLKTYGHLMPDSEDRTRRAIDDAWTSDGTQTESDHR